MLAWKAAKEVPTRILVASADVGALRFMVERGGWVWLFLDGGRFCDFLWSI